MIEDVVNDLRLISNDLIDIAMQEPTERLVNLKNIKLAVESFDLNDISDEPKELILDIVNDLLIETQKTIDKKLEDESKIEDINFDDADFGDIDLSEFDLDDIDLGEFDMDDIDLDKLD